MRFASRVIAGAGIALLAGCSASAHPSAERATIPSPEVSSATSSPTHATGDCPAVKKASGFVTIDYVDFIRHGGRDYMSGAYPGAIQLVPASQLGAVVFHVRCSLSELNDRTGKQPVRHRDGDAAFVHAGEPVYAVQGWSIGCRLAARHDGQLHLYLAMKNGGQHAAVRRCARSK